MLSYPILTYLILSTHTPTEPIEKKGEEEEKKKKRLEKPEPAEARKDGEKTATNSKDATCQLAQESPCCSVCFRAPPGLYRDRLPFAIDWGVTNF